MLSIFSQRPRASAVQIFDRGNSQRTLTFSVSRNFPTQEAADLFLIDHADSIDRTKTLKLISRETAGREVVRWLRGSKLEALPLVERKGTHLVLRYQFRGAFFSTTETDAS